MRNIDSDLSEILDAHVESISDYDDEPRGSRRDKIKSRYMNNKYLEDEDVLFDEYDE